MAGQRNCDMPCFRCQCMATSSHCVEIARLSHNVAVTSQLTLFFFFFSKFCSALYNSASPATELDPSQWVFEHQKYRFCIFQHETSLPTTHARDTRFQFVTVQHPVKVSPDQLAESGIQIIWNDDTLLTDFVSTDFGRLRSSYMSLLLVFAGTLWVYMLGLIR